MYTHVSKCKNEKIKLKERKNNEAQEKSLAE
jgi:hypothetical protein